MRQLPRYGTSNCWTTHVRRRSEVIYLQNTSDRRLENNEISFDVEVNAWLRCKNISDARQQLDILTIVGNRYSIIPENHWVQINERQLPKRSTSKYYTS